MVLTRVTKAGLTSFPAVLGILPAFALKIPYTGQPRVLGGGKSLPQFGGLYEGHSLPVLGTRGLKPRRQKLWFFLETHREMLSLLLTAAGRCPGALGASLDLQTYPGLCPHPHVAFLPVPVSNLPQRRTGCHRSWGGPNYLGGSHLEILAISTSAKTLSPNKIKFTRETQVNPLQQKKNRDGISPRETGMTAACTPPPPPRLRGTFRRRQRRGAPIRSCTHLREWTPRHHCWATPVWPVPGQKTLFPGVERERRKPLHLPASVSVGMEGL